MVTHPPRERGRIDLDGILCFEHPLCALRGALTASLPGLDKVIDFAPRIPPALVKLTIPATRVRMRCDRILNACVATCIRIENA